MLADLGADVIKVATTGGVLSSRSDPRHAQFRPDELDVLAQVLERQPHLARQLRDLVVLEQSQVFGDDRVGRRALESEVPALAAGIFLYLFIIYNTRMAPPPGGVWAIGQNATRNTSSPGPSTTPWRRGDGLGSPSPNSTGVADKA